MLGPEPIAPGSDPPGIPASAGPSRPSPRENRSPNLAEIGPGKPRRLSEEITGLIALFGERSVRMREMLDVLHGRAYTLLVLLLAIPFCTPLPLVGISTPFGAVIALIGFRLALGQKPWLPRKLLDTRLPSNFFSRVLHATRWLVRGLEALLRPRLSGWVENRLYEHAYGVIIFICGLLLMLPLPIPLTNGLPALTIVLLAGATLERDGVSMCVGLIGFALTLCLFSLLSWGGAEAIGWLKHWLGGLAAAE